MRFILFSNSIHYFSGWCTYFFVLVVFCVFLFVLLLLSSFCAWHFPFSLLQRLSLFLYFIFLYFSHSHTIDLSVLYFFYSPFTKESTHTCTQIHAYTKQIHICVACAALLCWYAFCCCWRRWWCFCSLPYPYFVFVQFGTWFFFALPLPPFDRSCSMDCCVVAPHIIYSLLCWHSSSSIESVLLGLNMCCNCYRCCCYCCWCCVYAYDWNEILYELLVLYTTLSHSSDDLNGEYESRK